MELAGAGAGEAQFQRARLLVGALMQAGVRRAVTSPGSRSTPLVLAALDAAALAVEAPSKAVQACAWRHVRKASAEAAGSDAAAVVERARQGLAHTGARIARRLGQDVWA